MNNAQIVFSTYVCNICFKPSKLNILVIPLQKNPLKLAHESFVKTRLDRKVLTAIPQYKFSQCNSRSENVSYSEAVQVKR